ncbi:hypothetical protein SAMN04487948_11433 [Halogranum amylolyticum]|uniref:Uncharacterized protein n=1 Tax=Halogranum amylolyticum TaxID=660520 RepID=A0A1H8V4E0_9EURY|nr:hypothetical protein [Halogranum amylolyticum]SEP10266.1 hypothetical protein SAMN04487948_11433 [Halogranum amylolyticum]
MVIASTAPLLLYLMRTESPPPSERNPKDSDNPTVTSPELSTQEQEASIETLRRLAERTPELLDEYFGSGRGEQNKHILDELSDVVREADQVLASVDFPALLDSVRLEDLPDAIDAEKVPGAVTSLRPQDAIPYKKLLAIVELREAFNAVDVREFRRNHRELGVEIDDVMEYLPAEIVEEPDETSDEDLDGSTDSTPLDEETKSELLASDVGKRVAVQTEIDDAVVKLREHLLEVHETVREQTSANELASRSVDRPNSRNPTAYSTLPSTRPDIGSATRFASIPSETRYSSAPNYERIYGNRFQKSRFRNPNR